MIRTRMLTAVAIAAAGLGILGTAGIASASTADCTAGAFAGYCGTQTDHEAIPLSMDVRGQAATYNNQVIAWPNSTADPATDFVNLAYKGDNALGVEFMYAPSGKVSGLCVSDPFNAALGAAADSLVLRACNGSRFQRWVATSAATGFTWKNVASGLILQSNGKGAQLTDVAAPVTLLPTQEWTFAG